MRFRTLAFAPLFVVALVAGCSSSGSSPSAASQAPASVAPASQAPASQAPASQAPASAAASAAASTAASAATGVTIEAKPVGNIGTVLVASNGMTVYTFTKDVKDSGKSACSGGCATTWPALTLAAGATPTAGTGLSGKLGTITRDDGKIQVTYNGLPLYFFMNDKTPGDANGVYTNWAAVKP